MISLGWSYRTRNEAGKVLTEELLKLEFPKTPIVLAIPNGGLAVAEPIARALDAELDLIIVRKLQIPWNPEAGFGALTSLGTVILNKQLISHLGFSDSQIESVIEKTKAQIATRKAAYAGLVGHVNPAKSDVILVDDGLASGYTMMAAVKSVSNLGPTSITVAVPTASARAVKLVQDSVDRLICPRVETGHIFAVANAYQNWYDVPDSEVVDLLQTFR